MRFKTFAIAMTAIMMMAVTPAFAQEEQGFKKFNVREDFTENGFQWFHDAELLAAGNRSAGGSRTFFIPASYFKLSWEEFLDKYLELVSPGSFYVSRADLERDPRIKAFLGF